MNKTSGWLALITFAVVLGGYLLIPHWHSRQVRHAAYERYSDLGETETIREIVDTNHDEIFEQCYLPGGRRTKANFDVDKYARLMDAKVERALGRIEQKENLAAHAARQEARRAASASAVPAPIAPTPTPNPHTVEVRLLTAKPIPKDPTGMQFAGRLYRVEVDVVDEQGDLYGSDGEPTHFTVKCKDGGSFSSDRPTRDSAAAPEKPLDSGVTRLAYKLLVPDITVGAGVGLCELAVQVHDKAGNVSNEQKVFIAMR